jgi:hypothetical protein
LWCCRGWRWMMREETERNEKYVVLIFEKLVTLTDPDR